MITWSTARLSPLAAVISATTPSCVATRMFSIFMLVDLAVQPGQAVQAGERLAVIEAMKMENILVATQDGVVGELLAAKGDSLSVDQPILSFQ